MSKKNDNCADTTKDLIAFLKTMGIEVQETGEHQCFGGLDLSDFGESYPCPNYSNKINRKIKRWVIICKKLIENLIRNLISLCKKFIMRR
jgi:hypothetical protein